MNVALGMADNICDENAKTAIFTYLIDLKF